MLFTFTCCSLANSFPNHAVLYFFAKVIGTSPFKLDFIVMSDYFENGSCHISFIILHVYLFSEQKLYSQSFDLNLVVSYYSIFLR